MKIVSGGQTGVDRAALDVARELGLPYGGYVPRGRWTEEGPLDLAYAGMVETEGKSPGARTKRNVLTSEATLIFTYGECEGGTLLTLRTARESGKPHLVIDLSATSAADAVATIRDWMKRISPEILNVAGPRASKRPAIYAEAKAILHAVLGQVLR